MCSSFSRVSNKHNNNNNNNNNNTAILHSAVALSLALIMMTAQQANAVGLYPFLDFLWNLPTGEPWLKAPGPCDFRNDTSHQRCGFSLIYEQYYMCKEDVQVEICTHLTGRNNKQGNFTCGPCTNPDGSFFEYDP